MTQESRESLIELLFLALYLDNHLSLAEDNVLNEALDSLGWESNVAREKFIFTAFEAARAVHAVPETTREFVISRADRIRAHGDEAVALTWMSKILGSDGLTPTEQYFLKTLEGHLFPEGDA